MYEIEFHPSIDNDLLIAAKYYEEKCDDLGLRFLEDYDKTIKEILNYPKAWPILENDIRRHQLKHFPFGIIYRLLPNTIRFLIVMNLHQAPETWNRRN
jgi:toxin ParE1/3/4